MGRFSSNGKTATYVIGGTRKADFEVTMLKHLKETDVQAIIAAAERNNSAHPASEIGITLEAGLKTIGRVVRERKALQKIIELLSPDARQELMALMWLGRGDTPGSFADHLKHAKNTSDAGDVDYIAEKSPSLPLYLRAGLARLKSS